MEKAVTMLPYFPMFAVRLWITTSSYRWPVGSLPSTCMLCTSPLCTKDVYTPQGSAPDVWTVLGTKSTQPCCPFMYWFDMSGFNSMSQTTCSYRRRIFTYVSFHIKVDRGFKSRGCVLLFCADRWTECPSEESYETSRGFIVSELWIGTGQRAMLSC
jgi:hypothetical protein